jgi:hypothetical protein
MPLPATLNEFKVVSPITGKEFYVTAGSKAQAEEIFARRMALIAHLLTHKEAA